LDCVPSKPTSELCSIGRKILADTNYPILSTRTLAPERYLFPASSLEAKKALLLSLAPMLTDAEEQRVKETNACELFTRCKSGKGRGRFASYDYADIDINRSIEFEDYERR
jgi:hypothetical protein